MQKIKCETWLFQLNQSLVAVTVKKKIQKSLFKIVIFSLHKSGNNICNSINDKQETVLNFKMQICRNQTPCFHHSRDTGALFCCTSKGRTENGGSSVSILSSFHLPPWLVTHQADLHSPWCVANCQLFSVGQYWHLYQPCWMPFERVGSH